MRCDVVPAARPRPAGWLILLAGLFWLGPGDARADQPIGAPKAVRVAQVAVLPFATTVKSLEMYGKPVADAVARSLARELSPEPRIEVFALSLSGSVPARVDWVIDGRIVTNKDGIRLEAGLRDPERGLRLAHAGTRTAKLTDIDQLADALGAALAPHIERARAPRQAKPKRVRPADAATDASRADARAPAEEPAAVADPNAPASPTAEALASAPTDAPNDQPTMVIFRVTGRAAGGVVELEELATRAAEELAMSLGFRPQLSDLRGILSVERAAADVRERGARLGLMLDIRRVDFAWYRVLAARARFRAILFDPQGQKLYDRALRTDTVVGNRGDRHPALVRFVMNQVMDIIRPYLRRAIDARGPRGSRGLNDGR